MSTPTSPEPRRSQGLFGTDGDLVFDGVENDSGGESTTAERGTGSLTAFRGGEMSPTEVALLSDLDREAAARFAIEWSGLPETIRERVVRTMDELAEDRLELNFGRALRIALDDPSPVVRQLAVAALWEDERQDLIDPLRELLARDPSQDVRAEAARGLGRFAQLGARGMLPDGAGDRLREELVAAAGDERAPETVRQRALESAAVLGSDPEIRAMILDAYESDDQAWQGAALYAMAQNLDSGWLPMVIQELANPDAQLRFEAARACGAFGDEAAIPELVECAADDDPEVRHAAIGSLGQIGGRAAVRALERLSASAGDADRDVIEAALAEALALADPFGVDG